MYSCLIAGGEGWARGDILGAGGGGNGLIFKHISTGRLGLGAGGGRGTLPGLPLPRGAEKQISRGRGAPI